jgi:hypothetical protein
MKRQLKLATPEDDGCCTSQKPGGLEWKEAKFAEEKYDTGSGKWQEAGHVDRCVSLCSAETSRAALQFPADTFSLLIRYLAVSKPANLNKHSPMFSRRFLVQK